MVGLLQKVRTGLGLTGRASRVNLPIALYVPPRWVDHTSVGVLQENLGFDVGRRSLAKAVQC